jgi:hypothetical protein
MAEYVHLGPPRLGRVIVVEGDDSKTTIFSTQVFSATFR